ncbi:hypothetical protein [Alloactinosynnema sp. L-07]|uniref:S1 family peptidase n=1 Tax=Alloactinosynnema sp. L-07 TaxID=1653480 RepID=UPI00065EF469|nr:serine protease [Alloactinosynnema sp. L-07]CRK56672.1 hypothetical protein [Alloactinosynnema sp. L-07]
MSSPGPPAPADERWRVRIRDAYGIVRGAGLVVCTRQVLTCAHVVGDRVEIPDAKVVVEFVGMAGTPSVTARVAEGCWVPVHEDGRGDVVLLDLDSGGPQVPGAPLRRLPSWGRRVRVFGFPDGAELPGVWAQPVMAGPGGPDGEWIQLDSPTDDTRVTRGFSGSAVTDHETGWVVGMVVSEYRTHPGNVSWMLPVETILRYQGGIVDCVAGSAAVDQELAVGPESRIDVGLARGIASWFSRKGGPRVRLLRTGEPGSSASSGLRRMIMHADREMRPPTVDESIEGAVPPVGSVDLAVDATGKTVHALRERIVDRFGASADMWRGMSLTLVVAGVDDSAAPELLLRDLLKPLADSGVRLLLEFRRDSSPAWALARGLWPHQDMPDDHPDVLRRRLDDLAALIAEVSDREEPLLRRRDDVAARIVGVPDLRGRAVVLRLRLSALRRSAQDTHVATESGRDAEPQDKRIVDLAPLDARVAAELDDLEASADRAARRLVRFEGRLTAMLERRRELRARLDAYHAMAADLGLAETVALDLPYRRANDALWRGPCDLAAAARLVGEYQAAVSAGGGR